MELDSALLTPAAGEAPPRRVPEAALRRWLNPMASLLLRAVVLLLAIVVLAVTATIPDELMAPRSALRAATIKTTYSAVLQLAWVLPLAGLDAAAAVLGNRLPRRFRRACTYYFLGGGDVVVANAALAAASGSLGLAVTAAEDGADWPRTHWYASLAAASFMGFVAMKATALVGLLHAEWARATEFSIPR
ncbi:hypothetical protein EJB05_24939 [Eragrostis curvula]|uniref:CASP-like protein n=1 Tax=Eragrostis curvula TaxID=38414 RepID=A0A5J9VAR9_9POAL|nr:hypothetical protein EJB05_24939 [Eragrostis curvula]